MLKAIRFERFEVEFRDFYGNKDYVLVVKITPSREDDALGIKMKYIVVPHFYGVSDTNITDKDYSCIVLIDDNNTEHESELTSATLAFFIKKLDSNKKPIDTREPAKVTQIMEEDLGSKFRSLKGPDGNSSINVGDNSIEIVSGDTKILLDSAGITFYGNTKKYELPSDSQGGMIKETSFMRLFPKCFVPPFSIPDYLPDMNFMLKVSNIMTASKGFYDALKGE